jgi:hypothetical protein
MSKKDGYYGILVTYNTHDKTWYAFYRRDVDYYWAKRDSILKGSGSSAEKAIDNYLKLKNEKTIKA